MRPLVLRNRNFLLLWLSQVLSQAGNRMFQIATLWWIITTGAEDQGLALAIFLVLGALPPIFLVHKIGRLIDDNPSRLILIAADSAGIVITLVCLALLWNLPEGNAWLVVLYTASILYSSCQAIIEPALQKSVPELVDKTDTTTAVAFLSSTQTLSYFAGAILGAIFIQTVGLLGVIAINGTTYLLSLAADRSIHFREAKKAPTAPGQKNIRGLAILRDLPVIKKLLFGFAAVNFFSAPILVILPVYTKQALGLGAGALGIFEASIWIGLFFGSFLGRYLSPRIKPLTLCAALVALFGVFLGLPGVIIDPVVYSIALAATGLVIGTNNVRIVSYFQESVSDHLKGRFFSLMRAMISAVTPVSFLLFGVLLDVTSPDRLHLVQGGAVLFLSIYFIVLSRRTTR